MARLLDTRFPNGLLLILVWLTVIVAIVLIANLGVQATPLATNPPCDPGLGPVRVPDLSWFRAIRSNRI